MKISISYFIISILLFSTFTAYGETTRQEQLKELDAYINDTGDGSNFSKAVAIYDNCDYSDCQNDQCVMEVFKKTVFRQSFCLTSDN